MELKKRWIVILILVLGITAALELSPRTVVVRSTLPPVSTCPCNDSPYGTSMFLDLLRENGMNVTIVTGLGELKMLDVRGYDSVLLLVVAADNLGPNYATIALDHLTSKGVPVYVAVFDEYPTDGTITLLDEAGRRLCGLRSSLVIARVFPSNSEATAVFASGARLQTGYTSYLSLKGTDQPVVATDSPYWSMLYGYKIQGWVWPSSGSRPGKWTPLAASCNSTNGGVLLVADSSIVINEALQSSRLYGEEAIRLIRGLVGGQKVLVVVDQGMYLTQQARVAISLHPSFLVLRAGELYARLEEQVLGLLDRRGLAGAVGVLAGAAVMTFSWASSASARSLGEKKLRIPRPGAASVSAVSCEEMISRLDAVGARSLVRKIEDPDIRSEAERYLEEVYAYCSSGLAGRILGLLTGAPGRGEVYRMYVLLLGILGVEPTHRFIGEDKG